MSTYIHFTEEQRQRAAAVDLEEFLRFRGEKLIPSGREKRLAKDHSVTVRGNEWYDHAEERGGHAVSFVQRFYNLSYPEAVTMLLGGEVGTIYPSAAERVEEPPKPFALPPIHSDMRRVYAYLVKHRSIDRSVVAYVAVAGQIQGDPRFPEAAWPYLDFAKIGAEYYADHGGAYTHAGYVLRKQDDALVREKKSKVQLDLSSAKAQAIVCLPATKEELERVKRTLGIDCFAEAAITRVSFSVPYMDEHIPTTGVCVEDANELAWAIEGMQCDDGELLKYLSVLSVEQPGTMQEALRYAMNLDDYERIPEDAYEYGQTVLRRIGADDELIDTIDGYMDFEKLGEDAMVEDGVRRTEFGLIRRCSSPFAEETQAMEMEGLS